MKGSGCLIATIITMIFIIMVVLLQPSKDPLTTTDESENIIELSEPSINEVEAGSVKFFAEQGPEEYKEKLSSLERYPDAVEFATYLYNNSTDLMNQKYLGNIIVIHGEVDRVETEGNSLTITVPFYKNDKYRMGSFNFGNDSFAFAKGCQPGDYIILKGTVKRISVWAKFTDLESSKIHYNFGPLEK